MDRTKRIEDTQVPSAPGGDFLPNGVHRRSFLQFIATAFGSTLIPEALSGCSRAPVPTGQVAAPYDFTTLPPAAWVVRPDDMVSLGVQLANLTVDANRNIVATSANDAYVVLTFPSQHVAEAQFNWPGTPVATQLAESRAAGPSRLVFQIPAGFTPVPYSLQGILSLCALGSTRVATNALSYAGSWSSIYTAAGTVKAAAFTPGAARLDRALASHDPAAIARHYERVRTARGIISPPLPPLRYVGTGPTPPVAGQTALEIPHRVLMSPTENAVWRHAAAPVTDPNTLRTELWHTRMAMRDPSSGHVDERIGGRSLRALWTRDWDIYSGGAVPALGALDGVGTVLQNESPRTVHRDHLVRNTGDLSNGATPPLTLDRLILTPFGATVDVKGAFPGDSGALKAYAHDIHLGRDEYVEIVSTGWVLPHLHHATMVTVSKRNTDPAQGAIGQIYSWNLLLIGKPLVSFAAERDGSAAGTLRQWPFAGVELLDKAIECTVGGNPGGSFPGWITPKSGGTTPLTVSARGIDVGGSNVNVKHRTPLYFVPASDAATLNAAISAWNAQAPTYTFDGQRIAFAPASHDETTYETSQLTVTLATPNNADATLTNVAPVAVAINVAVDAVRHLTGNPSATTQFEYHPLYAASGFDAGANPNEVFFRVASLGAAPKLALSTASKTGGVTPGFVTPDMTIALLSRKHGPVSTSDPNAVSSDPNVTSPVLQGALNPTDFFGSLPKLFGFISLKDILTAIAGGADAFMPKCVTQALANAEHLIAEIESFYARVQSAVAQAQQFAAAVQNAVNDATTQVNQIAARVQQGTATATDLVNQKNLNALLSTTFPAQAQQLQAVVDILQGKAGAPGLIADAKKLVDDIAAANFGALVSSDGTSGDLFTFLNDVQSLLTALSAKDIAAMIGGVQKDIQGAFATVQSFVKDASTAMQLAQEFQSLVQGLEMAKNLTVKLEWRPKLGGLVALTGGMFRPVSDQALRLAMEVRAKALNGKPAGADIVCRMDSFLLGFGAEQGKIQAAGLDAVNNLVKQIAPSSAGSSGNQALDDLIASAYVSLVFDHMQFQMLAGQKPDVDISFKGIHFGGPLKFIETLRNSIPLDGFSDPPYVDVTPDHVAAGFDLALPNVAIGMFSLENLAISAGVQIPILSDGGTFLTFRFAFCSKDSPFLVTVSMLGGGGFFALTMNEKGLDTLEAAIEVCAMLSIDLGIAAGCVSIEAGIYLKYTAGQGLELTGYLRIRGSMSILGLITLSVELYMSLTYYSATGKVVGYASITVEIDISFWSCTVSVSCERKFAGANGDPTFDDLMAPAASAASPVPSTYAALGPAPAFDPFADYCLAYAAA